MGPIAANNREPESLRLLFMHHCSQASVSATLEMRCTRRPAFLFANFLCRATLNSVVLCRTLGYAGTVNATAASLTPFMSLDRPSCCICGLGKPPGPHGVAALCSAFPWSLRFCKHALLCLFIYWLATVLWVPSREIVV